MPLRAPSTQRSQSVWVSRFVTAAASLGAAQLPAPAHNASPSTSSAAAAARSGFVRWCTFGYADGARPSYSRTKSLTSARAQRPRTASVTVAPGNLSAVNAALSSGEAFDSSQARQRSEARRVGQGGVKKKE